MGKPVILQHLRQLSASSVTLLMIRHLSPICNKLNNPIEHSSALILSRGFESGTDSAGTVVVLFFALIILFPWLGRYVINTAV